MNSLHTLESFLQHYHWALLALSVLVLMVLIQNFLTAPLAFLKGEQTPGEPLKGNHQQLSFRVLRTHANSVENIAVFGFALLLAILATANPSWVNGLAIGHVIFRMAFWAVYYSGIGKVAGGLRTMCFVGGLTSNIILGFFALVALL
ncbi:MAG: MAPEG family protein [Marinicella sp.]|nr:MAPEG family protein [Xanthomonadales bacterium]